MNRCLQKLLVPEWMTKGKDPLKEPLQTTYMPTYDVENTYSTNKGSDLFLANKLRIVPWGTERMLQRIQRHKRTTLHWSAHPERKQNKTQKSSYGLDWRQKGIRYGLTKLENVLPQNVQNIRWSHKLYRENYENLKSGIDCRRKKLSWSKDPKRYISRSCTITITNYNCDDVT